MKKSLLAKTVVLGLMTATIWSFAGVASAEKGLGAFHSHKNEQIVVTGTGETDGLKDPNLTHPAVGNHTVDHSNLNKLNESSILQKINNNNDLFKSYTGSEMKLVRCPYGNSNKKVRGTINNPIIYWSVDSRDWESRNTDKIYNLV